MNTSESIIKDFSKKIWEENDITNRETELEKWLKELYSSITNNTWLNKDIEISDLDNLYSYPTISYSFRSAGGFCAEIYNSIVTGDYQKDYLDYYCHSPEGEISDRFSKLMEDNNHILLDGFYDEGGEDYWMLKIKSEYREKKLTKLLK